MKGRGNKQESEKKNTKPFKTMNNETYVPILNWSSNFTENNLRVWKEQMSMYAMREYGHLGLLFDEDDYYEPPEVEPPEMEDGSDPFSEENDPHGLRLEDYKSQIKERRAAIAKLEANKIPLYAFMMTKISSQSKTALMREPTWEQIDANKDALALWLLIQTTHLGGNGGNGGTRVIPGETDRLLYKNLESTKQGETENLSTYLRRFQCALECYDGAEINQPADPIKVALFIENLHDHRFKYFKSKLKNDYHQNGIDYPESLNDAFRRASDWELDNPHRVSTSSWSSKTSVSYHVNMEGGRGRGRGRGRRNFTSSDQPKEPPKCYFCEKTGHVIRNCEKYKAAKSTINNERDSDSNVINESRHAVMALSVAIDSNVFKNVEVPLHQSHLMQTKPTGPDDVLLDSQSQDHIFQNHKLLHDIKPMREVMTVHGQVCDADFSTNHAGRFMSIKRKVYVSDQASANLLSLSQIEKECQVEFRGGLFQVTLSDGSLLIFRNINDLYICNIPSDVIAPDTHHTRSNSLSYFTKSNNHDAAEVLIKKLGYPSDKSVVKALQSGSIHNSPCTSADIYSMRRTVGPALPALKGKSTKKKLKLPHCEELQPLITKSQELHVDIMQCEGLSFLISVSRPMDLTLSTKVDSNKSKDVKKAVKNQVDLLRAKNFEVSIVHSDGGLRSLHDFILSLHINHQICAAGAHIPIVERKIRVIKERMRTILFSLPFLLPNSLMPYLVTFVTRTINMVATSNSENQLSAFENFLGRRINYNVDLRIYFGMYCQVLVANIDNSLEQRTTGAIALTQTNSTDGAALFYDLNTKKIIRRNIWTELKTPQDAIDRMNMIAMEEKAPPTKNPKISVGSDMRGIDEVPLEEETPEVLPPRDSEMIPQNRTVVEIDPTSHNPTDSEDSDSDYAPSDHSDIDFVADFEEDANALVDDATHSEMESRPSEVFATPPSAEPEPEPPPHQTPSSHERRYPERLNRGWNSAIFGYLTKSKKFLQSFGKKGEEAINLELSNMLKKGVFHPVHLKTLSNDEKRGIIPSFIFLKQKYKPSGELDKVKARLVAGGNHQDKSMFPDTSSPTADINHIFIEVTLAAARRYFVASADIGAAFLNADMNEPVHMYLDKRTTALLTKMYPEFVPFVNESGKVLVKLDKALYGCIQSALLWYKCLAEALCEFGFTPNYYDECIFSITVKDGECTIIVYVDDLLILSNNQELVESVISHLQRKFGEINVNRGDTHSYLGMEFYFHDGEVNITMKGYIEKLLNDHNVKGTSSTPAGNDLFTLTDEPVLPPYEQKHMHSSVAQLLYLSTRVRPDILLPVNFLSTRVNKFDLNDKSKMDKVLRYLNDTKDLGLVLKCPDAEQLEVTTSADASYGVHPDGKGQSGMLTSLGIGAISSSTTKQKIVAKSSSEAELIASSDGVSHLIKINNYLQSRNYNVKQLSLMQDNLSTQSIIKNGVKSAKRMRHLNIRYFFVKQYVEEHNIKVNYIKTSDMVADIFTKPLQGEQFLRLRDKVLGLMPMYEESE